MKGFSLKTGVDVNFRWYSQAIHSFCIKQKTVRQTDDRESQLLRRRRRIGFDGHKTIESLH